MPATAEPTRTSAQSDSDRDWLSCLHPYGPALFSSIARPVRSAQAYIVKLTSLRDGASVFVLNEGKICIAAARAGILYRSGPRVWLEAKGLDVLTEAQALRWLTARQRRSGWEAA